MNQLQALIQKDQLEQLSLLLQQSLQGINTQENYTIFKQLESKPQSYLYFLTLLISPLFQEDLRQLSGLTLKNMLRRNVDNLPADTLRIIKQVIFEQYDMQAGKVLKTLGLIMGMIVQKMKFDKDTLDFLLEKANQGNAFAMQGLKRIVEDFRLESQNTSMLQSQQFARLAEQLVLILLPQCQGNSKQHAIDCFNMLIYPMPVSLVKSLHPFVGILKVEILNPNLNIALKAMQGLEAIASTRKDLITQQIIQLVAATNFTDPRISKVQANFWIQVIDSESEQLVRQILHLLLPRFILGLTLTNEDISNIMELKKFTIQKQQQEQVDVDGEEDMQVGQNAQGGDYTLRKRCALIVRRLSIHFSEQLWELSKNYVIELIKTNEWLKHQVAILYIGSLVENCQASMESNIGDIIAMISNTMNNSNQHLLKSTCLWTLSEFTDHIVSLASADESVLNNYLSLILNAMKDQHTNVRSSACTSLNSLVEGVKDNILPWVDSIFAVTSEALQVYRGYSLYCLFQFYATLAENIRTQNFSKKLVQEMLIPLCHKWNSIENADSDICALVECLVSIFEKGKSYTVDYIMQVFKKTVEIFNPKYKQIFLRAVDLVQVLVTYASAEDKLQINQSGLTQKTVNLITTGNHQIKQACYSLLSVIVQQVGVLNPQQTLAYVLGSIDEKRDSEANNCLFCMLEIVCKYPQIKDYIDQIAQIAVRRLLRKQLKEHFLINCAKVIGTLSLYHPQIMAPYLKSFFITFCRAMKSAKEHNRKYHIAMAGLFKVIPYKSQDIFGQFRYLVDLGICMKNVPLENQHSFIQLLKAYRQSLGNEGWQKLINDPYFLPGAVNKINLLVNS